mmetsp:Transcript_76109/g.215231  ORF Transcript_76109/g.215231 Transcript_76109/m.215231 type:complete len:355 (+) Transcript_76109:486-1550(+)
MYAAVSRSEASAGNRSRAVPLLPLLRSDLWPEHIGVEWRSLFGFGTASLIVHSSASSQPRARAWREVPPLSPLCSDLWLGHVGAGRRSLPGLGAASFIAYSRAPVCSRRCAFAGPVCASSPRFLVLRRRRCSPSGLAEMGRIHLHLERGLGRPRVARPVAVRLPAVGARRTRERRVCQRLDREGLAEAGVRRGIEAVQPAQLLRGSTVGPRLHAAARVGLVLRDLMRPLRQVRALFRNLRILPQCLMTSVLDHVLEPVLRGRGGHPRRVAAQLPPKCRRVAEGLLVATHEIRTGHDLISGHRRRTASRTVRKVNISRCVLGNKRSAGCDVASFWYARGVLPHTIAQWNRLTKIS